MSGSIIRTTPGVSVVTTARLHMGFFDLNGGLGRRYGSIGLTLDQPATELHAWRATELSAEGPGAARALSIAQRLSSALGLEGGMHLALQRIIPEHAGLGSGTQMSLAVGLALSRLYGLDLDLNQVAQLTGRGARSGIGLGTFAAGGVIVDGGRGEQTIAPPVIARADFPEDWRVVLIFDHAHTGVHGAEETAAFRNLPEFSADVAAGLCRRVLMQALPALAEHDLAAFGTAIGELQQATGDHFAPAQGGRYASQRVTAVLQWLAQREVACYGQSSWGPTGFALFACEADALDRLQGLQTQFARQTDLQFVLCRGLNRAAQVVEIQ